MSAHTNLEKQLKNLVKSPSATEFEKKAGLMYLSLQKQIRTRMESKQLSAHALEKKAGLKRSAVRNILQGLSKRPSAATLMSIAAGLGCSLADLVEANVDHLLDDDIKTENTYPWREIKNWRETKSNASHLPANKTQTETAYPWQKQLYADAVEATSNCIEERALELEVDQVASLINETYRYAFDKNSKTIDRDFTKWLTSKY